MVALTYAGRKWNCMCTCRKCAMCQTYKKLLKRDRFEQFLKTKGKVWK